MQLLYLMDLNVGISMTPPKGAIFLTGRFFSEMICCNFYETLDVCASSIDYEGEYFPKSNMISGYSPKSLFLNV